MSEYHIGQALKQFIDKSRLKSGINAARIEVLWEELMGKTISKYTEKIQIINSTLFVTTTVGPLKQELIYQKKLIIERINEAFGEKVITDVVIN